MANVKAIIDVDINTSPAAAGLRSLQGKFNAFAQTLNTANASHSRFAKETSQQLSSLVNASQFFTAETVQMRTAASQLDMTLARGGATMGQFFSARFRKDGLAAAQVMSLANARASAMQTQFIATGQAANGMRTALAIRPLQAFNTAAVVTAQKLAIQRAMLNQATTSMINFGKNTQWAGRQLMVGFTVPLTIFAGVAGKAFRDLEKEAINFRKVYGDIFTTDMQTEEALKGVRDLSLEFTKYGVEAKKTMELAAIAAQAGQQGAQLMAATTQATRLAVLGDMENQDAMRTTIALQSAFKMSNEDLAESINFLNMVENSSVLSLQDVAEAIPRVAPVIQGLGGDVKDLAVMLVAMREGGVSAAEGANGLKSSLGRLITPSKQAIEMAEKFGISLQSIARDNAGDVLGMVTDLASRMERLPKLAQQQLLSTIFGKFQFARIGALFENITREGSQAQKVIEMMGMSTQDMARTAEKELSAIEDSVATKFTAAMERAKVAIAPIGEMFIKMALPIVNFFSTIIEKFNNLPDFAKNFLAFGAALVGIVIPAGTMFAGLLMNLIGTLVKVGHLIGLAFKGFTSGGLAGAISNVSQALNYMSLEQIDAVNSATQMAGATTAANAAFQQQIPAAAGARAAIDQLGIGYDIIYAKLTKVAAASALAFAPGGAAMRAAGGARGAAGAAPRARGTNAPGFNQGGSIPGKGNTDTVPAMLTPGEFVVNKQATQENLPLLYAINDGQKLPGFNKGGRIPGMQYFNRFMSQRVVQPKLVATRDDLLARVSALQETSSFSRVSPTQAAARVKMKEADAVYQEFMRQNAGGRTKNARVVKFAVEQLGISPTELGLSSRGNFGFALTPESNIKMQKGVLTKQDLLADIQNPNSLNPFADQFSRYFNGSVNREKFIRVFEKSLGSVPVDNITNSRFEQISRRALHEYLKSEGIPKQQRGSFMRDILTRTEISSGLSSQRLEEALTLRGINAERGSKRKEIYVNHNGERLNLGRLLGQEIGSLDKPQEIKRFTSQRDNKRLVPRGLVFAHANEGGMIPGVQYFGWNPALGILNRQRVVQQSKTFYGGFHKSGRRAGKPRTEAPKPVYTSVAKPYGDAYSDDMLRILKDLGINPKSSVGRQMLEPNVAHGVLAKYNPLKGKAWNLDEIFGAFGAENKGLEYLLGLKRTNARGIYSHVVSTSNLSKKEKMIFKEIMNGRHPSTRKEISTFQKVNSLVDDFVKNPSNKNATWTTPDGKKISVAKFLRSSAYKNWKPVVTRIFGARLNKKMGGVPDEAPALKLASGGMIPGVSGYMAGARVNPALAALRKRRAQVVIAKDKDIDNIIFTRNKDGRVDPDAFDILTLLRHNPNMNDKQLKNIQKYLAPRIKRGMSTRLDKELGYKVRDRQAGTWKTIARVMEEKGYPVLKRNKGGIIPGGEVDQSRSFYGRVGGGALRLLRSYMAGNYEVMQNAQTRKTIMGLARPMSGTFYRGTQLGAGTLPKHIEREMRKAEQTGDFSKLINKRFRMRGSDWSTDQSTAARFTELNQVKSKRDFLLYEKSVDEKILREASENLRMVRERGKPSWMPQSYIDQWEKSVIFSQKSLARINKELAKIGELSPLMIKAQGKIKGVPASQLVPDATYLGRGIKESNVISAGGMFEIRRASRGRLEIVPVQARNMGGPIFESGSKTIVPGVGNTDTVPAALTPGEFVVNKQSTRQNLPLLQAINSGGEIPMFNKGGMIPGMQYLRLGAIVNPMSKMKNAYRKMTDRGGIYFRGGLDSSASDPFSAQSLNFVAYQRRKFLKDKKIGSIGATKTPGRMSLAREDMQPPGQGLMFDPSPIGKPWTIGTMAVRPGYERVVAQLLGLISRETIRRSGLLPGASTNLSAHSSKIVEMLSKRGIIKDLRPNKTDLNEIRKRDARGMIKDSNDVLKQSRYQWNVDPEEIQKSSNLVRSILRSTRPINTKRSEQLALFNNGGMIPGYSIGGAIGARASRMLQKTKKKFFDLKAYLSVRHGSAVKRDWKDPMQMVGSEDRTGRMYGPGIYSTTDKGMASRYADPLQTGEGYVYRNKRDPRSIIKLLRGRGYVPITDIDPSITKSELGSFIRRSPGGGEAPALDAKTNERIKKMGYRGVLIPQPDGSIWTVDLHGPMKAASRIAPFGFGQALRDVKTKTQSSIQRNIQNIKDKRKPPPPPQKAGLFGVPLNTGGTVPGVQYFNRFMSRRIVQKRPTQSSLARSKTTLNNIKVQDMDENQYGKFVQSIYKRGEISQKDGYTRQTFQIGKNPEEIVFVGGRVQNVDPITRRTAVGKEIIPGLQTSGRQIKMVPTTPEGLLTEAIARNPNSQSLRAMLSNFKVNRIGKKEQKFLDNIVAATGINRRGEPRTYETTGGFAMVLAALSGDPKARSVLSFKRSALYRNVDKEKRKELIANQNVSLFDEKAAPADPNKVAAFHMTKYPIVRDRNGNIILSPSGDKNLGSSRSSPRSTVHFTAEGQVQSHLEGKWDNTMRTIVTPLSQIKRIKNIIQEDTWASVSPGQALKLSRASVADPYTSERKYRTVLEKRGLIKRGDPAPVLVSDLANKEVLYLLKNPGEYTDKDRINILIAAGKSKSDASFLSRDIIGKESEILTDMALQAAKKQIGIESPLQNLRALEIQKGLSAFAKRRGIRQGEHSFSESALLEGSTNPQNRIGYSSDSLVNRFKGSDLDTFRMIARHGQFRTKRNKPADWDLLNLGGIAGLNNRNIVPGVGNKDTVPAMLTPGEFVINKQATQQNLDLLHAINNGTIAGYQTGGIVIGYDENSKPITNTAQAKQMARLGYPIFDSNGVRMDDKKIGKQIGKAIAIQRNDPGYNSREASRQRKAPFKVGGQWYSEDRGRTVGPFNRKSEARTALARTTATGTSGFIGRIAERVSPLKPAPVANPEDQQKKIEEKQRKKQEKQGRRAMARGALGGIPMMASFLPIMAAEQSPDGKFMGQDPMAAMMGLMGAGALLTLPPKIAIFAAAIAAAGGSLYMLRKSVDGAAKEGMKLGSEMGGTGNRMEQLSEATGYQFALQRENLRAFNFSDTEKEGIVSKYGEFFESEQGQKIVDEMRSLTQEDRYKKISSILAQGIADGMSLEDAKDYGNAIAFATGDAMLRHRLMKDIDMGKFKSGPKALVSLLEERAAEFENLPQAQFRDVGTSRGTQALNQSGVFGLGKGMSVGNSIWAEGMAKTGAFAAGGAIAGAVVGSVVPIIGTAVGAAVGALIGTGVGAFKSWKDAQDQIKTLNENVGRAAQTWGLSSQVLKEAVNAEAALVEARRKGSISDEDFVTEMAKVKDIKDQASFNMKSIIDTFMTGTYIDSDAMMEGLKDQLVLSGFSGDLASAVTNAVNYKDVAAALFPDFTVEEVMQNENMSAVVKEAMVQTLSGITPENAQERIAEIQGAWARYADDLAGAAVNGILDVTLPDVQNMLQREGDVAYFVQSRRERERQQNDPSPMKGVAKNKGGLIYSSLKMSNGNIVPGVGNTDTVPAILTPGEFVVNKQATKNNLGILTAINNGSIQGFRAGGLVVETKSGKKSAEDFTTEQKNAAWRRAQKNIIRQDKDGKNIYKDPETGLEFTDKNKSEWRKPKRWKTANDQRRLTEEEALMGDLGAPVVTREYTDNEGKSKTFAKYLTRGEKLRGTDLSYYQIFGGEGDFQYNLRDLEGMIKTSKSNQVDPREAFLTSMFSDDKTLREGRVGGINAMLDRGLSEEEELRWKDILGLDDAKEVVGELQRIVSAVEQDNRSIVSSYESVGGAIESEANAVADFKELITSQPEFKGLSIDEAQFRQTLDSLELDYNDTWNNLVNQGEAGAQQIIGLLQTLSLDEFSNIDKTAAIDFATQNNLDPAGLKKSLDDGVKIVKQGRKKIAEEYKEMGKENVKNIQGAMPGQQEFVNMMLKAGIDEKQWGKEFDDMAETSAKFWKNFAKDVKKNGTVQLTAEMVTTLFGEDIGDSDPQQVANDLNAMFPDGINPALFPIIMTLVDMTGGMVPGGLTLGEFAEAGKSFQKNPNENSFETASGKNITRQQWLGITSFTTPTQTAPTFRPQGPGSGSSSGGSGKKSLLKELQEQFKLLKDFYKGLSKYINSQSGQFKKVIAGPFASEFIEFLKSKGEEGIKILKGSIQKFKQVYKEFIKIQLQSAKNFALQLPSSARTNAQVLEGQAAIRQRFRDRNFSEEDIDTVLEGIGDGTAAAYKFGTKKQKKTAKRQVNRIISQGAAPMSRAQRQRISDDLSTQEEDLKNINTFVSRGIPLELARQLVDMGVSAAGGKKQLEFVNQTLERLKNIKVSETLNDISDSFESMNKDIQGTVKIMQAIPGISQEAIDEIKALGGDINTLTPEKIREINERLTEMKRAAFAARPEIDKLGETLGRQVDVYQAQIETINRIEIRPLELRIVGIEDTILPIQDEIRELERAIRPLQKEINAFQKEIDGLQKKQRPLQKDIEKLREEEEELNKHYEERSKVLDKVSRANEKMIAQQRGQLDIASALSRGDVAGAARATRELQATMAQQRMDDAKEALEEEREQKRLAITTQIEAKEKEIKSINEQIEVIQEKIEERQESISYYQEIIADKQELIADKQREIEMIQREIEASKRRQLELEEKIYKAQLLQSMLETQKQIQQSARIGDVEGVKAGQAVLSAQMQIVDADPNFFAGIPRAEELVGQFRTTMATDYVAAAEASREFTAAMLQIGKDMTAAAIDTGVAVRAMAAALKSGSVSMSLFPEKIAELFKSYNDGQITFNQLMEELKKNNFDIGKFFVETFRPAVEQNATDFTQVTTDFNSGFLKIMNAFLDGLVKGLNAFFGRVEQAVGQLDIIIPPVTLSITGSIPGRKGEPPTPVQGSVTTSQGQTRALPGTIPRIEIPAAAEAPERKAFGGMIGYRGSTEPAPGMAMGGMMKKYATGNFVPGIGITDKVAALLTPGEFVVRKSVAQQYAPLLQSLNSQVYPQFNKFAMGGMVGSMRSMGMNSMFPSFKGITRTQSFPTMQGRTSSIRVSGMNGTAHNSTIDVEYNYSVNVNAQTDASPDDIANAVVHRFRRMEARQVKGTRIG